MANDRPLYVTLGQLARIPDADFVDPGAGVQHPNGTAAAPSCAFNTNSGFFYDTVNSGVGLSISGTEQAFLSANQFTCTAIGGGFTFLNQSEASTTFSNIAYAAGNSAVYSASRARGTIASPSVPLTGDLLGTFRFRGFTTGASFGIGAEINAIVEETTWGSAALGSYIRLRMCADGATSLTEVARFNVASGLQMFGTNPVIDANRTLIPGTSTVVGLPAIVTSGLRNVSDLEGGQGTVFGGNTLWRNMQNGQVAQNTVSGAGILSKMTGYFNFAQRAIVNNTMQKLSDAGLLSKLLGLWVHAVPTNSTDALLNWITPGTRNAAIVGSPTWTASQGFTGDGSTGLIDTVASLTTFGATINNVSVGCYVRTAGTGSAKAVMGCNNIASARRMYFQTFTSGALVVRCNDQTNDNYTPGQYTGMFVMTRGGSTTFNASVNDAAATTVTRTSVTQTSAIAFLGTIDSTASEFSNAQISFSFIGTNLSTTDIANLRWILVDYYLVQIGAVTADYTVATLPLAGTPPKGSKVFVTDGLTPVFAAAAVGGGAVYTPVYTDLTTWRCG